jgi:hypothetical protein
MTLNAAGEFKPIANGPVNDWYQKARTRIAKSSRELNFYIFSFWFRCQLQNFFHFEHRIGLQPLLELR